MINEYELYSDERSDRQGSSRYLVLGGVLCTNGGRKRLLASLAEVRNGHRVHGEFRWQKTSDLFLDAYKSWLDTFFDDPHARYSILLVNRSSSDWSAFSHSQLRPSRDELLVSVFYQFLLVSFGHLGDKRRWSVFPDSGFFSRDTVLTRVEFLFNRTYKKAFGPKSSRIIRLARTLDSKQSDLVQLADLLLACASCSELLNMPDSAPKRALLEHYQARRHGSRCTERGLPKLRIHHWMPPSRFFTGPSCR